MTGYVLALIFAVAIVTALVAYGAYKLQESKHVSYDIILLVYQFVALVASVLIMAIGGIEGGRIGGWLVLTGLLFTVVNSYGLGIQLKKWISCDIIDLRREKDEP